MNIGIFLTQNKAKSTHFLQMLNNKFIQFEYLNFISICNNKELLTEVSKLDILLTYKIPQSIFQKNINKLKWVQLGNAGVDDSLYEDVINSKIIVTNSRGINAKPVSEFVMGSILYFSKYFQDCNKFKNDKYWSQWDIAKKIDTLDNKVLGIIGYGSIGKLIAKQAKVFNMHVIGVRRLQKKRETKKNIDELLPMNDLNYLLSSSDYIVVTCPLTPLTKHLLDSKALDLISDNSILINVSRGKVIEQSALIEKLEKKQIRGAALDVFYNEPLEESSKLFRLKNVFLSPHISGNFKGYQKAVLESFSLNLSRFLENKTLKNRICKRRLY